MNWLRSKAKRLSLLALFALALQFGLSFGHFHNDLAVAAASASQSQASTPDTDHDQHAHRDLCAICSTVAMTSNAVTTATPSLPLPLTFAAYRAVLDPESVAPDSRRGAFRSRAPPQS
ncbi:MAG: DUF2946 family protein [Afipia sp.]